MAGKRPYLGFEHGTLRAYTMADDPRQRLTALSYRLADHAFITNGDCLAYAERIGIEHYSPMIHPVDVDQHRRDFGGEIERLRASLDADVVLYCPLRHDWKVKGTDVHLRALPLIKARVRGRVKLILIRWGAQIADSEALIQSLGCSDNVLWRPSMCRIAMIKHMRAADVVLDQMALPHFGATAPQAMAAGTPVISSYVPESTRWIIPEPAPILPAFSPEEVAQAVVQALDPAWRADYERRARRWIDTYHHPNIAIREHLKVYRSVLEHDRQHG
jgi:glycosyltransferase involved in cell wall biosynthesis